MIPASEYESRRQRLFDLMDHGSALLVYAGVPKVSSADEDSPFEVNRNFYYLTGIDQEGSALLLINSDGEMQEFLFVLPYDPKKERWYGKRLTTKEASLISGLNNVLITTSLQGKIDSLLNVQIKEYGDIKKFYLDFDREIKIADSTYTSDLKNTLSVSYPNVAFADCYPLITTLRLRKSMHEIAELRAAIATTKLAIYGTWAELKAGKKEYELADTFLHIVNDNNRYQGLAFPTIMASGMHCTCLHYPTPLDTIKKDTLVLMDLGARNNYYCADVTRTVPVSGTYTPEQLSVYNIVLACNKMIADMAKPGVTIDELQSAAVWFLTRECLAKNYIEKKEDIIKYYFHSISHFIGLDTHDPYMAPLDKSYKSVPLEPGMVISDEPGLYMENLGIGVRIEDDLLITENGCEVLTKDIVKEPKDIERFLASRR
jgi:Xaa-Pro aminopeptidase